MPELMIGVIGGSGLDQAFTTDNQGQQRVIKTPFGEPSSPITLTEWSGVPVALLAAVVAYLVLWRTPTGFRLRAVGHSPEAARAAGINVKRNVTLAMALSGSLAGIAGSILVFGSEGQRMVTDGSAAGFTGSAGFNGIVAALFGGLHPLWTIPSAMLFGALLTGATQLQRVLQVPAALAVALNGIIVIFVISSTPVRGWLQRSLADSGLFNRSTDHVEAD